VSTSINLEQIKKFINEVNTILNTYIVKKTTIYYVDTEIKENHIDVFGRHGTPDFSKAVVGGGTDFHPPFERLKEDNVIPDIFVYFTDGESEFPSINFADISKYENRIFWCVVNDKNYFDELKPGYGHLIHINYSSI
jgi:predicted metal-dependent peptidase